MAAGGSLEKVIFRVYTEESEALAKHGLASVFRTLVATRESTAKEVTAKFVKTITKGLTGGDQSEVANQCTAMFLVDEGGKTLETFKEAEELWPSLQTAPKKGGTRVVCSSPTRRAQEGELRKARKKKVNAFSQACQGPIFDMPLEVIMSDQGSGYLPWIVEKCLRFLANHMKVEGLFRVCGSSAEVEDISEAFDRGEDVQLEKLTADPHVVAGVLMLFVSTLPEPLLTYTLYKDFVALKGLSGDDRIRHARSLLDSLPEHNYAVLEVLCQFFASLAKESKTNQMTSANISNVFAPAVLYCEQDRGKSVLTEVVAIIEVFQTLIDHADVVFGIQELEGDITSAYDVEKELGTGAFAVVKVVRQKTTGTEYAAKFIDKSQLASEDKKMLEREVSILKRLRHPHIISLKAVCETQKHLILITELARGGELFDRIAAQGAHEEAHVMKIARQLISAIGYLHSRGIAHRDLKPENILLRDEDGLTIKLADFGLGRIIDPGVAMSTMCGTPSYVAPEVLLGEKYDLQVDMWSVGVIVYILLSGRMPFFGKKMQDLAERIISGQYAFPEERWGNVSATAKSFVRDLLQTNPRKRLTPRQAYNHAFLRSTSASTAQLRLDALEHREVARESRKSISEGGVGASHNGSAASSSSSSSSATASTVPSADVKPEPSRGLLTPNLKPHKFSGKTFHKPTWCDECNEFLWGVVRQGHQCRNCRANVHKTCIDDYSGKVSCEGTLRGRSGTNDSADRKSTRSPKRRSLKK